MVANITYSHKQIPKLSLKMWLPLLQCATNDLSAYLTNIAEENPFLDIKHPTRRESHFAEKKRRFLLYQNTKNAIGDTIERTAISECSLYETLFDQIHAPLFPTEFSRKIAYEIIEYINEEGFFEGNIEYISTKFGISNKEVENIRKRFAYIEPIGVGARDFKESFLFQLDDLDIEEELHLLVKQLIFDLDHIDTYGNEPLFLEAKNVIKKFKNPPAIDYFSESKAVIPEVIIMKKNGGVQVGINDRCYPKIDIKHDLDNGIITQGSEKKKEARKIFELLNLRKETLREIVNFIAARQIPFFYGEHLAPLAMREIAAALGYSQSTISRAIAGKYLQCERGVFPLKNMFAYTLGENISNENIKHLVHKIIQDEDKSNPMSDETLVRMINGHYKLNLARRSITKYRLALGIENSSQRKLQRP